jgi:hypothetical protein
MNLRKKKKQVAGENCISRRFFLKYNQSYETEKDNTHVLVAGVAGIRLHIKFWSEDLKFLLSFGAESFVFQFTVYKCRQ